MPNVNATFDSNRGPTVFGHVGARDSRLARPEVGIFVRSPSSFKHASRTIMNKFNVI